MEGSRLVWERADRTRVRYAEAHTRVEEGFRHRFTACIEEGWVEDELNRGLIRLWELRRDWGNRVWVYARWEGEGWSIHMEEAHRGVGLWEFHGGRVFPWGAAVVVEVERGEGGYRLDARVEGGPEEGVGWLEGSGQGFDRVWMASTIKSRRNNHNWSTGYVEALEAEPPVHPPLGG